MASVLQKKLKEALSNIRSGALRIPSFQREFVWNTSQVKALLNSIRSGIPIGTVTTWEQAQESPDELFEEFFSKKASGKKALYRPEVENAVAFEKVDAMPTPDRVQAGVIDGRQRLTSLLMCFGGVTTADGRSPHAGLWYYDLSKPLDGDECPFDFEKLSVIEQDYPSMSSWIRKARFPLWLWERQDVFIRQIVNPAHYENGNVPADCADRLQRLSQLNSILSGFDIAFYIIDKATDLSTVCEVFELLNTMGTKVSVFDIIAAKHFGSSEARFDLRERAKAVFDEDLATPKAFPLLSKWFDENNGNGGKVVCNVITGAFLNTPDNLSSEGGRKSAELGGISSFKGKDLISTPLGFYSDVFDRRMDGTDVPGFPGLTRLGAAIEDFASASRGITSRVMCPYPILLPLYLSLRYDQGLGGDFPVSAIDDSFRVFFWRTSLLGRYDQGFLTGAVRDRDILAQFLRGNAATYATDKIAWWNELEKILRQMDLGSGRVGLAAKKDLFLATDLRGARSKTAEALLFVSLPRDLHTRAELLPYRDEDIHLHHVFPRKWVNDNCVGEKEQLKCFAALVPLSSESNVAWRSQSPEQQLATWHSSGMTWSSLQQLMESVLINESSFALLVDAAGQTPAARFKGFIDKRAQHMAEVLAELWGCRDLTNGSDVWRTHFRTVASNRP